MPALLTAVRQGAAAAGAMEEVAFTRGPAKGFRFHGVLADGMHRTGIVLEDGLVFGSAWFTYPPSESEMEMVETIIASFSLDPSASFDPLTTQGISLTTSEGFVLNPLFSTPITLMERGESPLRRDAPSSFTIASGPGQLLGDLTPQIQELLNDIAPDWSTLNGIKVNGLLGVEVEADGIGPKSSRRLYILLIEESPTQVVACAGEWPKSHPEFRDRFRKMALSVRLSPSIFGPVHLR